MENIKLTEKQQRFCDYYIENPNATEAARKAGYSERYLNTNANKLLQNTTIKAYIEKRLKQMEDERIANADEVLKYLTSIMRGEHTEEVVVVEGIGEGCSEARLIDKDISARERLKAAELLGKRYSIFSEKVDISGSLDTGLHKLGSILDQLKE